MHTPHLIKTLHLTNAYHPASGGIRSVYRRLLTAANADGRQLRLVVPGEHDGEERVGPCGLIYYVKAPPAFAIDSRYRLIMPTRYLLPWVRGIRQILRHEQPDLVEICDKHSLFYIAGLLKKGWMGAAGRPTLVATSAERFDDNVATFLSDSRAGAAFARWYMRRLYAPMFDYHLANSTYTAAELLEALPSHRTHTVHVTPPSLAGDCFEVPARELLRMALLHSIGGGPQTRVLVYVGRLSKEKNLGLLVAMLDRLIAGETAGDVEHHLVIGGDGPERSFLEQAAARLGHRMHLRGTLADGAAVRTLLAGADVFVHPNPKEPFGLAPLEAMACHLPVVVPDRGGVMTYADADTAWLAEPTAAAFAAAVAAVLGQPAVAQARCEAGAVRAAAFHERVIVPRFFSLLEALHAERLSGQAAALPAVSPGVRTREAATSR